MFENCEFLLCKVRYVHELEQNLLYLCMFNDLRYCTKIKHDMLKYFQDAMINAKESKIEFVCFGWFCYQW